MNISLAFTRLFFALLSIFFMTTYMVSLPEETLGWNIFIGVSLGVIFSLILIGFDTIFRKFNLRAFNIAIIGLLIGYLMGLALILIFGAILDMSAISVHLKPKTIEILKIALFLFGTYTGTIMTLRASDELYVSIPFVKFAPTAQKKRDLIIDTSVLSDARIIDLASTGLLDHQLVIPRFLVKDLYVQMETGEEVSRNTARRALSTLKKLEELSDLDLRYNDTDFPEVKETHSKLIRLARLVDANIMTSQISRVEGETIEGVRFVNMNALSTALKPLMQAGETITIRIQRYGKEHKQGVGYLEDGAMVVVNGGGDYIGQDIEAQVLSVKHTSSGRMIFCNAIEGDYPHAPEDFAPDDEV